MKRIAYLKSLVKVMDDEQIREVRNSRIDLSESVSDVNGLIGCLFAQLEHDGLMTEELARSLNLEFLLELY